MVTNLCEEMVLRTEACRFTPRLRRADMSYDSARDATQLSPACTAYSSSTASCTIKMFLLFLC